MVFSSAMTKQASTTWWHTGAPTTDLHAMDEWMTRLLADYSSNAKLSTLRFGTSSGIEESVNSTSSGVCVLRRERSSYSTCLKTYQSDGSTLNTSYADTCDYDSRYTSWYQAGRSSNSSSFSDTYDNKWLAAVTKVCPTGVGSACDQSDISGVWAGEWEVSSVGHALAKLIDGLEGSLAVIDFKGIVLSTSSGTTLEPALTCSDDFIREGSTEAVAQTDYFKTQWSGHLLRETFVGLDVMYWTDFSSFHDMSSQYWGMMVLERRQLYREYEKARNAGLAAVCFGLVLMGMVIDKFMKKTKSSLLHSMDQNSALQDDFEDALESTHIRILRERFEMSIEALECWLGARPIQLQELQQLDASNWLQTKSTDAQELSIDESLQWVAISFLQDLAHSRDVELHLALLLCGPMQRRVLIPLFRFFSCRSYWTVTRLSLALLLWLQLVENNTSTMVKGALIVLLCLDGIVCCMFHTLQSRRVVIKTRDFQGEEKDIVAPGITHAPLIAAWLYLMLLAVAFYSWANAENEAPSNTVSYVVPVLVILQNEDIWPACFLFVQAVEAAGSIVYIWVCLLLLLSGQACVLLHGQFNTGDDYTDSQFEDFFHSLSTISVFLIDGEDLMLSMLWHC